MKELESNSSWFARFSFDEEAKGGVRIDFCEQVSCYLLKRRLLKNSGLIFRYFCCCCLSFVDSVYRKAGNYRILLLSLSISSFQLLSWVVVEWVAGFGFLVSSSVVTLKCGAPLSRAGLMSPNLKMTSKLQWEIEWWQKIYHSSIQWPFMMNFLDWR